MHGLRGVGRQLAGFSVLNFLVPHSLQELLDGTLGLVPLAKLHVLSVVPDLYVLSESDVLVQLKENAAAEKDVLDAVERGHWLSFELLLDAFGAGEVEDVLKGPESAFVHEDESHLDSPGLVGCRPHLLADEPQGRSRDSPSEHVMVLC